MNKEEVSGLIVDIHAKEIFSGKLTIKDGSIVEITRKSSHQVPDQYILPGFIDAHIHIESSMMVPAEFARVAVRHGTVATVSDPHEIANVLGVKGVDYMIDNGNGVPFKFYFGAPSCVPATSFETAGAEIGVSDIKKLLIRPEVKYLAEMMDWPGVLSRETNVMGKIRVAHDIGKPVDGHAPGLRGDDARHYADAGISTDHECFTFEEAKDKLRAGMKILIREGSAARNFDALIPLIQENASELMFCSDDKHPDELIAGHIDELVRKAIRQGFDLFDVLRIACLHPVEHYGLEVGTLRIGDPGDFIIVDDLTEFDVIATYLEGRKVYDGNEVLFPRRKSSILNQFECKPIDAEMLQVKDKGEKIRVIKALDGQLVTKSEWHTVKRGMEGEVVTDLERDILKIVVVNRYFDAQPAIGFIHGIGLKEGAIASSVAHDSHNIVAVGVDDGSIVRAVNRLINDRGGISCIDEHGELCLALPVAGLMSTDRGAIIAENYKKLDKMAKDMGSRLRSPFMTLSFMALLVIPHLKLSDRGLFDGHKFEFVDLIR